MDVKVFANDELISTELKSIGSEKFEVSFVPSTDVEHKIEIEFNRHKVLGSPFIAEVEHGKNVFTHFCNRTGASKSTNQLQLLHFSIFIYSRCALERDPHFIRTQIKQ